jgi:hypothetical protein
MWSLAFIAALESARPAGLPPVFRQGSEEQKHEGQITAREMTITLSAGRIAHSL